MFDMQKMMAQVQKMQQKADKIQVELGNTILKGSSGGGIVEVEMNGKNEFQNIKLKPEAINPENPAAVDADTIEMIEDLITSAMKDATEKSNKLAKDKMSELTAGMNIPGGGAPGGLGGFGNFLK